MINIDGKKDKKTANLIKKTTLFNESTINMNIKSKCFIEDEKIIDSLFLAPSKKKKKNKESSKKSLISFVSELDNSIHSNTSHKCNDIEILIVDDEEINRKVIMNNLTKFKINYETAVNGIDCLKRYLKKKTA